MNALSTCFLLAFLCISLACEGLSQASFEVETALLPLPAPLREEASIMAFAEDGTVEVLRPGTNAVFCIADTPDDKRFSVECHPLVLRAYVARRRSMSSLENRTERDSLLTHAVQSGELALPVGATSHFVSGPINPETGTPDSVRVWSEMAVPFLDTNTTGLNTEDAGTAPWMMNPAQHGAHIMVGYRKVAWADLLQGTQDAY